MAFDKVASFKGSAKKYRLSPAVKRYTLRDQGFTETKAGNFQLLRSLDTTLQHRQGVMVKITVSKELDGLKFSTTTANGLRALDIYGNPAMKDAIDNLEYLLDGLVEANVLDEAE